MKFRLKKYMNGIYYDIMDLKLNRDVQNLEE